MGFEDSVYDLGGDAEDLKLLENLNSDESEIEGSGREDNGLAGDVDKMWAELSAKSGLKVPKLVEKPTKKVETTQAKFDAKTSKAEAKSNGEKKPNTEKLNGDKLNGEKKPKNEKSVGEKKPNQEKQVNGVKNQRQSPQEPPQDTKKQRKLRAKAEEWISTLQFPEGLALDDMGAWWDPLPDGVPESVPRVDLTLVPQLKEKARKMLDAENSQFHRRKLQEREYTSSLEFLKSGTFSDQLGTLSILSTESPLHSIRFLENLASKCESKNRESACKALEVTKDLLVSHILPDRRLLWFKDEKLVIGASVPQLILWSFEDWLKQYYYRILQCMERLLTDTVEAIRLRALHCCFDLFKAKPEQEANLLRLGLNKLGDPEGKVASQVKKLLMDSLQMHPSMKGIVATAVSELLARSADYRTRYYSIDTLSEFIFSHKDAKLPNQLIYIYLELFERLLAEWDKEGEKPAEESSAVKKDPRKRGPSRGKKGGIRQEQKTAAQAEDEQRARLVSKIFTGLNRAFPFSELSASSFDKYTNTLYRMSHSSNVGTFIEALNFIFQLAQANQRTSGQLDQRFYRTLYASLLDERLHHSAKLSKYIHLLLRALSQLKSKDEPSVAISTAFAKRLLQVASQWPEVGAVASLAHVAAHVPHISRLLVSEAREEHYDSSKRDPLYAKAETSKLWDIVPLLNHYHPTVALYANNIIAAAEEKQSLDMPDMEQYTVNSFLNKWSYRKPKDKENTRGGSIFQPLSGYTDLALGIRQQGPGTKVPITLQDWTKRTSETVAPDEQFYLQFFQQRPTPKPKSVEEKQAPAGDEDDSDAGEDEIFQAMLKSGELGSDISDDDDNDLKGLSDMSDGDDDSSVDEDALKAAFGSDSDLGSDVDVGEAGDGDLDGDLSDDLDGDLSGDEDVDEDDEAFDDDNAGGSDSDAGVEEAAAPKEKANAGSKRKREWSGMPTFMDADAFEETLSKRKRT